MPGFSDRCAWTHMSHLTLLRLLDGLANGLPSYLIPCWFTHNDTKVRAPQGTITDLRCIFFFPTLPYPCCSLNKNTISSPHLRSRRRCSGFLSGSVEIQKNCVYVSVKGLASPAGGTGSYLQDQKKTKKEWCEKEPAFSIFSIAMNKDFSLLSWYMVLLCHPNWPSILQLKQFSCLGLPSSYNRRCAPLPRKIFCAHKKLTLY